MRDEPLDVLTVKEVARICRVGDSTVWRWLARNDLPRTKIGGRTYVTRAALDAYLAARSA